MGAGGAGMRSGAGASACLRSIGGLLGKDVDGGAWIKGEHPCKVKAPHALGPCGGSLERAWRMDSGPATAGQVRASSAGGAGAAPSPAPGNPQARENWWRCVAKAR